jgi:hypothetical protein
MRSTEDMVKEVLEVVRDLGREATAKRQDREAPRSPRAMEARRPLSALRNALLHGVDPLVGFSKGDSVEHPENGKGVITRIVRARDGDDYWVHANFETAGPQEFWLRASGLTKR